MIDDMLLPSSRYAIDACALAHGATGGPALLCSSAPHWEHALRMSIGDQLFTSGDPDRPVSQAWGGAVWLEPQRRGWRSELDLITRALPQGGLLSIVLSLPLARIQRQAYSTALGVHPLGLWQLRASLHARGFRVERAFGFGAIWSTLTDWIAVRLRTPRPDWSDRLRYAARRGFATRRATLPFAEIGLLEIRAGMRP